MSGPHEEDHVRSQTANVRQGHKPVVISLLGIKFLTWLLAVIPAYAGVWAVTTNLGYPDLEPFLFLPLLGIISWRAWRLGVVVTDDRLIVRNFWRTYDVPWEDVASIGYADWWPSLLPLWDGFVIAIRRRSTGRRVFAQPLIGRSERPIRGIAAAALEHPHVVVRGWLDPME